MFKTMWSSHMLHAHQIHRCQLDRSHSFSVESKRSGCAVHRGYGMASWQSSCCMCICIIMTRCIKLRSNCQTRQCGSNITHNSVTIPCLKCLQKHTLVHCLAVKWERGHLSNAVFMITERLCCSWQHILYPNIPPKSTSYTRKTC